MASLSEDFDAYSDTLRRRNGTALMVLVAATVLTAVLIVAHGLEVTGLIRLPTIPLDGVVSGVTSVSSILSPLLNLDDLNALHMSALTAQIAAWAALRLWFTRQERMTTLLTHALVLENEKDAAIKVLLHKDMHD